MSFFTVGEMGFDNYPASLTMLKSRRRARRLPHVADPEDGAGLGRLLQRIRSRSPTR
ncbi:MAG: hypothetical protein R2713_22310 [Ilumatobacteraceae bacterium]